MNVWIVLLKVFGYIWLLVASILILAGYAGTWMKGGVLCCAGAAESF